ncbi:hypothetical protein Tco_0556058 [Tanacetum coccineum]
MVEGAGKEGEKPGVLIEGGEWTGGRRTDTVHICEPSRGEKECREAYGRRIHDVTKPGDRMKRHPQPRHRCRRPGSRGWTATGQGRDTADAYVGHNTTTMRSSTTRWSLHAKQKAQKKGETRVNEERDVDAAGPCESREGAYPSRRSYALSWKPCQGDSLNLPDHRAQVDQGSQIKMIQVKEMMQDNDLKNSKSKDKGSKSRSQSMDEQSHYKQDKTITRQSINVKRHIFNVIGGTEEFEERDLNIGGDC